jgi:hypothetical protein
VREAVLDGVPAEALAGDGGEQWIKRRAFAFGLPHAQNLDGLSDEWCSALFPTFPTFEAVHMRSSSKHKIAAREAGHFGDSKSTLDCEEEKRVVAPPSPGRAVAGSE